MDELRAFLDMGGHGAFIWPAFALTAAVMVGLLLATLRRLRERQAALAAIERQDRSRARP